MKNPEEAIERVLAGLRDADVPEGIERRILSGLQDRAPSQAFWGWRVRLAGRHGPFEAAYFLKWGMALAGVCAIAFVVTTNHRPARVTTSSKTISVPGASPTPVVSDGAANSLQSGVSRSPMSLMAGSSAVRTARATRVKDEVDDADSLALEEMRAPSLPPPPMPLTAQERLLLRVARNRDPGQLTALNPALREAQYLEEKAEVEKFFEPKTIADRE